MDLLHDVKKVKADYYLQTHSTNPLLRTETISRAIKTLLENKTVYDSLFSVTKIQVRLWDELARAINHNPKILLRTQHPEARDIDEEIDFSIAELLFSKTFSEEEK